MAIINRSSTTISNNVVDPPIINSPPRVGGRRRHYRDVVASAADDSATSVFRFFRVRSSDTVVQVALSAAAAGGGTPAGAVDCGLYQTTENGGAVVNAALFGSAVSLTVANNSTDITFESGQYTYAASLTKLWQALGLAADPNREYDVALTVATTFSGGPTSILLTADVV